MKLDTTQCEHIADAIAALKSQQTFSEASLQSRHESIQSKLTALESFFRRLALLVETNEESLSKISPIEISDVSGASYSATASGSVASLLTGKSISGTLKANYALGATHSTWTSESGNALATTTIGAIEGSVQGKASLQILKDKKFNPKLEIEASGKGHLMAGTMNASVKEGSLKASAMATGEVGAIYGSAKAAFSVDEQVLKAQVGAAVARGECSLAIELLGVKLTIGLSGSFGGVEAGFEYSNKVNQWTMGFNGALFAGGGLRIQIDY